ncbi:MAG: fibronectin type III domain-containing protein [Deltaproteobacteria bacterium]|nr:fibronectin type III domain-containing protein [Deltaproteobacteria bacterium]
MRTLLRGACLVALALLLGASPVTFRPAPAPDFDARLATALDEGRINAAHAALYRLFALKAPDRLPAEFRADRPEGAAGRVEAGAAEPWRQRCGTTVLRGLRADLAELPEADRAEVEELLSVLRPAARAERAAGKTVTHQLPNWILTKNFSIEWGADLTDVNGSNPGHPTDADGNGVPDVVDQWARYFEASYQAEVVDRGYTVTALAGQYIPVYLGNSAAGTAVDDIGPDFYAITYDGPVTVVVNNDLSFVPPNEDPDGKIPGAMKVTAAHEFHHVLQFLMPLPTAWSSPQDDWWLEASATWMEDEVFDRVNDYYQYFPGLRGWASLAATGLATLNLPGNSDYTSKAYGNVIFAKYLSEHLGGAARLKDVWNLIAGGRRILFDGSVGPGVSGGALNRFAVDSGFSGVGNMYLGFAGANATMDYREGAAYGAVPIRATSLTTAASSPSVPLYLGAQYLASTAGTGAGVTVNLAGAPATSWGLSFAVQRPAGYTVVLGEESPVGAPSLALAAFEAGATLWVAPSYLTPQLPPAGLAPPPPPPNGYTTAVASGPAQDPPGAVGDLSVTRPLAAGGLDVAWSAPTSGGPAAGTVVRWKRQTDAVFDSRTLFGPITRAELRGLEGNATYDVEVFAYGSAGEEGPASSASGIAKAAVSTPTPPAEPYAEKHLSSSGGGGGGGGGGGCFVRALGW